MIRIKTFQVNPLEVNCYVVSDDTNDCVIIDCGCFFKEEWNVINSYIKDNHLHPVHLLNTHCHFDHITGNNMAYNEYRIMPEFNVRDAFLYKGLNKQMCKFGLGNYTIDSLPPCGRGLNHGDKISFGKSEFTVLETPGHSPGGICFYLEENKALFSGDTLFRMSIGRTDLEQGDYHSLRESILKHIFTLPPDTNVYCGHGPSTTIGEEIKYNPYI